LTSRDNWLELYTLGEKISLETAQSRGFVKIKDTFNTTLLTEEEKFFGIISYGKFQNWSLFVLLS
jgi:hypothetical protein